MYGAWYLRLVMNNAGADQMVDAAGHQHIVDGPPMATIATLIDSRA
jgi:hypothetical protein